RSPRATASDSERVQAAVVSALERPPPWLAARSIALDRADQVGNVLQMLGSFKLRQFQRRSTHRRATREMLDRPLGILRIDQSAIPDAFGIEEQIRPEIALAEAVVADQAGPSVALQERAEALAQAQPAALAAVRAAANHDVPAGHCLD